MPHLVLRPRRRHLTAGGLVVAVALAGLACRDGDRAPAQSDRSLLRGPNVVRYPLEPHRFDGPTTTRVVDGHRDPAGRCVEEGGASLRPGEEVQEIVVAYDPDTCRYEVVRGRPAKGGP